MGLRAAFALGRSLLSPSKDKAALEELQKGSHHKQANEIHCQKFHAEHLQLGTVQNRAHHQHCHRAAGLPGVTTG